MGKKSLKSGQLDSVLLDVGKELEIGLNKIGVKCDLKPFNNCDGQFKGFLLKFGELDAVAIYTDCYMDDLGVSSTTFHSLSAQNI